jgi:putative PIN family toxin of toxin-antitoxin system
VTAAPRVVLDTNVVLSALVFPSGHITDLRHAWQANRIEPLVSDVTAGELARTLTYTRFKLNTEEQQELLADYIPYCTVVDMPSRPPTVPLCRDPADLPFLQLATLGQANFLVTGDKDLQALASSFHCRIVGPAAFLALLNV